MSFRGKVILVTGGSAGIGATTAVQFAKEGASVTIVGRNEARLKHVAQNCEKFGVRTLTINADIAKDDASIIIKKTITNFGKLDILVNNAGILRKSSILNDDFLDVYDEVMATNMRALIRVTYYAIPHIINAKGNIVNVSSVAGSCVNTPDYIAYRTSKASLNHFTRCAALELATHGVRINAVSPGPVNTDIFDSVTATANDLKNFTALNRISEPEEIADLILYLASEKAKSITGVDYVIDNGIVLKKCVNILK